MLQYLVQEANLLIVAVLLLTYNCFWSDAQPIDQPSVGGRLPEDSNNHQQWWERRTDTYSCCNILSNSSNSVQAGDGSDCPEVTSAIGAALTDYLLNKDCINKLGFYVLMGLFRLRNIANSTSLSQMTSPHCSAQNGWDPLNAPNPTP